MPPKWVNVSPALQKPRPVRRPLGAFFAVGVGGAVGPPSEHVGVRYRSRSFSSESRLFDVGVSVVGVLRDRQITDADQAEARVE